MNRSTILRLSGVSVAALVLALFGGTAAPAQDQAPKTGLVVDRLLFDRQAERVVLQVTNHYGDLAVEQIKLKLLFRDDQGKDLGSRFLHVRAMDLAPGRIGVYTWSMSDFQGYDAASVVLTGLWVHVRPVPQG